MPGARVAVATCRALPELDEDGPLLLAALAGAALLAEAAVWDDPAVDWASYDAVLVRSTWDYVARRDAFLAWARRCRRLLNPADVLAWNTEKTYLDDLARAGVPTVPTVFCAPGQPVAVPPAWSDVVVKPSVSAASADTGRFPAGSPEALALVRRLHEQGRTVMLQPYLRGIDADGETALVVLGGELSHAVRKAPLLPAAGLAVPVGDDDPQHDVITASTATAAQREVAAAALAAVPGGAGALAYARVDLVPGEDGAPLLLELELTEPSLFLRHAAPEGVARLAEAVRAAAQA